MLPDETRAFSVLHAASLASHEQRSQEGVELMKRNSVAENVAVLESISANSPPSAAAWVQIRVWAMLGFTATIHRYDRTTREK
jgi:hypothetical protein